MIEIKDFSLPPAGRWVHVDLQQQTLTLKRGSHELHSWSVSTALNGAGEQEGSGCTPRGWHRIRIRIGDGEPLNTVFVGRRPSGEIWSQKLADAFPDRDWILTRILWLTGVDSVHNRGGNHDTLRRYIYIHGTPDDQPMGIARSHGCVRMRNKELVQLFDQVENGTLVHIE